MKKGIIGGGIVGIALLGVLLNTTNPSTAGPLGVLAIFVLMYMLVLGALTFLLVLGSRLWARVATSMAVARPIQPLDVRRSYYFASILALAPIMILAMNSVGEVGIYDLLLVALFATIATIYVAKRSA